MDFYDLDLEVIWGHWFCTLLLKEIQADPGSGEKTLLPSGSGNNVKEFVVICKTATSLLSFFLLEISAVINFPD